MDARSRRSRDSLRSAVLALAAVEPIVDVTVSEICREAAVTRDTFYRHADGPLDLLADALAVEIDILTDALPGQPGIGEAERSLLRHVHARAAVYRGAMHPSLAAPVRANLERSVRAGLETWVRLHPHIVPTMFADDRSAMRMAVAYAAAGTVGAIEEWLRSDSDEVDRAAEVILAASPEWWLR